MSEKKNLKIEADFSSVKEALKIHGFLRNLLKLKTSYTLKCLLATKFQFMALSGIKI